jgi:hypothetical protein
MKRKGSASSSRVRSSKKRNQDSPRSSVDEDVLQAEPTMPGTNLLPWCLHIEASIQLKRFTIFSFHHLMQVARKITSDEAMANKLSIIYIRIAVPELVQLDDNGQLQVVKCSKNRMTLLQQMYLSKWKINSWEEDNTVQDLIKKLCKTKTSSETKRKMMNDHNKAESTLKSRVEALGKQQMKDMEVLVEKDKVLQKRLATEELVQCADAIRLFIRGAMLRKGRVQHRSFSSSSTTSSSPPKPVRMTMGINEVLGAIQKTKTNLNNNECSKKHAREILGNMVKVAPEWIQIVKSKKNDVSNINSSIVVIQEKDGLFQKVRVKLGGRNLQASASSQNYNPKATQQQQQGQIVSIPTKPSNTDKIESKGRSDKIQRMSWMEDVPITSNQHIRPSVYKSKLSLSKSRLAAANTLPIAKHQSEMQVSLKGDDSAVTEPQSKSPQLRVNYTQVLTSADYDGGEVIESTSTNPRDLKRMFAQLNNGERI